MFSRNLMPEYEQATLQKGDWQGLGAGRESHTAQALRKVSHGSRKQQHCYQLSKTSLILCVITQITIGSEPIPGVEQFTGEVLNRVGGREDGDDGTEDVKTFPPCQ